ncbi:hypothetical protein BVRB_3g063110 [Beta vulgaris subsp. vulgaris]|nr:hypothetical protein BVRB_3g063110 [Beta vulgaris subsp. vulgaris]
MRKSQQQQITDNNHNKQSNMMIEKTLGLPWIGMKRNSPLLLHRDVLTFEEGFYMEVE